MARRSSGVTWRAGANCARDRHDSTELGYADSVKLTRHLSIEGRVQGVGFRAYMQHKARELGVTGWVRNRSDGSVEAVVQGAPEAVEAMLACARRGPRSALVSDVAITEGSGDYDGFVGLPTE